ncbi:hypothetical protein J6590_009795 [Homalodisca vitripennis]|nr:hypothetical protein J6590_009795 [Homalodisca vitripennis]
MYEGSTVVRKGGSGLARHVEQQLSNFVSHESWDSYTLHFFWRYVTNVDNCGQALGDCPTRLPALIIFTPLTCRPSSALININFTLHGKSQLLI